VGPIFYADPAEHVAAYKRKIAQPGTLCEHPEQFDFAWDAEYVYTNYTCMPICEPGTAKVGCLTAYEAIQVRSAASDIFST